MTADYEEYFLEDLLEEMNSLKNDGRFFDPNEWLDLMDKFLVLAEDDTSMDVLDPVIEMGNYLLNRGSKIPQTSLRLAKCHFHLGQFRLSRVHLDECFELCADDKTKSEALQFKERFEAKVTRDGKIGIAMLGGVLSIAFVWFLSYRKRMRESNQA